MLPIEITMSSTMLNGNRNAAVILASGGIDRHIKILLQQQQ